MMAASQSSLLVFSGSLVLFPPSFQVSPTYHIYSSECHLAVHSIFPADHHYLSYPLCSIVRGCLLLHCDQSSNLPLITFNFPSPFSPNAIYTAYLLILFPVFLCPFLPTSLQYLPFKVFYNVPVHVIVLSLFCSSVLKHLISRQPSLPSVF